MQTAIKFGYLTLGIGLLACALSGCSSPQEVAGAYPAKVGPPQMLVVGATGATAGGIVGALAGGGSAIPIGIVVGALAGGTVGYELDKKHEQELMARLYKEGISVLRVGDLVEVTISDNVLFEPGGVELVPAAYARMDRLVTLLKKYGYVNMTVIGHSDNVGTEADQLHRSTVQAQAVTTYLWTHDISSDRLTFYGVGSTEPNASFNYPMGQNYNRYVAIIFWHKGQPSDLKALSSKAPPECWTQGINPQNCH